MTLRPNQGESNQLLPKRYLSREEAAAYCGLGLSTLSNLACAGEGPAYIKAFGRVLYDVADLDEWLQSMKVAPSARLTATEAEAPSTLRAKGKTRRLSKTRYDRAEVRV